MGTCVCNSNWCDRESRTRNISSLFLQLCHRRCFRTMESLSVDIGRLKSGEVNLGVRFSRFHNEDSGINRKWVQYLDVDYGRPVQGWGNHRR